MTDGLGLVTLLIAILSAWRSPTPRWSSYIGSSAPMLVVLGSLLVGGIVGSLLRLEERVEALGGWLQSRLTPTRGRPSGAGSSRASSPRHCCSAPAR